MALVVAKAIKCRQSLRKVPWSANKDPRFAGLLLALAQGERVARTRTKRPFESNSHDKVTYFDPVSRMPKMKNMIETPDSNYKSICYVGLSQCPNNIRYLLFILLT